MYYQHYGINEITDMITLYGLKNCDTCKKALKALGAKDVTFVDIRDEADLPAKLPHWLDAVGAVTLVNKRSTTWRNLSEAEKTNALEGDTVGVLKIHPTLIKRPVIEQADKVFVGWTKAVEGEVV